MARTPAASVVIVIFELFSLAIAGPPKSLPPLPRIWQGRRTACACCLSIVKMGTSSPSSPPPPSMRSPSSSSIPGGVITSPDLIIFVRQLPFLPLHIPFFPYLVLPPCLLLLLMPRHVQYQQLPRRSVFRASVRSPHLDPDICVCALAVVPQGRQGRGRRKHCRMCMCGMQIDTHLRVLPPFLHRARVHIKICTGTTISAPFPIV